jgi:hypothetical protein
MFCPAASINYSTAQVSLMLGFKLIDRKISRHNINCFSQNGVLAMQSFGRVLSLSTVLCAISESAMAVPAAAPAPEIGNGIVGGAAATLVLMFVFLPRLRRLLSSKEG